MTQIRVCLCVSVCECEWEWDDADQSVFVRERVGEFLGERVGECEWVEVMQIRVCVWRKGADFCV
jgi:hypothetical protein